MCGESLYGWLSNYAGTFHAENIAIKTGARGPENPKKWNKYELIRREF